MLRLLLVVALFAVSVRAQVDTSSTSIILDSLERGVQLRMQRERLEMQRKAHQEQLRQMRTETDRLKAETELLKAETERLKDYEQAKAAVETEVVDSLLALRGQYPDLEQHLKSMSQLAKSFPIGSSITLRDYLEGLYVIAKFSSFVNRQGAQPVLPAKLPEHAPDAQKNEAQREPDSR